MFFCLIVRESYINYIDYIAEVVTEDGATVATTAKSIRNGQVLKRNRHIAVDGEYLTNSTPADRQLPFAIQNGVAD